VRSWSRYALVGLLVTLLAVLVAFAFVAPAARSAVWFAAGLAYGMQLVAFGALVALRAAPRRFMLGWAGGILFRFGAVAVVAFWLGRSRALPLDVTLVSLVTFVVLLLFLEPCFLHLRRARRANSAGRERLNEEAN